MNFESKLYADGDKNGIMVALLDAEILLCNLTFKSSTSVHTNCISNTKLHSKFSIFPGQPWLGGKYSKHRV